MKVQLILTLILTITPIEMAAQVNTNGALDKYFMNLKQWEFDNAQEEIQQSPSQYADLLDRYLKNRAKKLINHNSEDLLFNDKAGTSNDSFHKALVYLNNGYIKLSDVSLRSLAFSDFNLAYQQSKDSGSRPLKKQVLLSIFKLYRLGVLHNDDSFKTYLSDFLELCEDPYDYLHYYSNLFNLYSQTRIYDDANTSNDSLFIDTFRKLDSLQAQIGQAHKLNLVYYLDKGNYVLDQNPIQAIDYFTTALTYCDSTPFYRPYKFDLYLHLGRSQAKLSNYQEALDYVYKASAFRNIQDTLKDQFAISLYKAEYHGQLKHYDSAYTLIRESRYLEYRLGMQDQNAQIAKLEIENGVQEKEIEALNLRAENEAQRRQKRNLWIGAISALLFGGISFILIQKNTRRKQLLAEQERELQSQKLATVLKEQELASIDAMIEGQEKERQRIADDLHDDLGGLMATIKLHFEALKDNHSPKLFSKTTTLLDSAYQKIRTVAHAKNSGVMARQGLLKAIKKMARAVSESNRIQVAVIDHGLDERLENSLELSIFRIIQELITNVIKHARATEATIHITKHDDSLNIMVEDNGQGFDVKWIPNAPGMGINSIDKRVENLGGTITIESELTQGTSVIIDIPL